MITDIENTWVTSDNHFGHANIEHLCKRPPNTDTLMVEEWTRLVPADALLLHLGDVAYRADFEMWRRVIAQLPGDKHLIIGNHDKQPVKYYKSCGFTVIEPFLFTYNGKPISFSHYPLETPRTDPDQLRIHGHIHNNGYGYDPHTDSSGPARIGHINLSVEVTKYRPVHLGTLLRAYFS
jgi:calcineurin-like phosphoesterase family protein